MDNTFSSELLHITVLGGETCLAHPDETVLSALTRAGIVISAPCGGRGICGKCRVMLREGRVLCKDSRGLGETKSETELKPGDIFAACQGIALSDITIDILEKENGFVSELSFGMDETREDEAVRGKKIKRAGVGLDIGTTTVQAELVNLDTGESLESLSVLNAQRSFGADVMSRIGAARNGNVDGLFRAINRQVEDILRYFIKKWNLSGIERCAVSGNTAMLHLFLNVDPSGLGEAPFTPVFLEERYVDGTALGLSAEKITILPGISAFVGGDIVSGLAFLNVIDKNEDAFFVDIGTNGEMALWKYKEKRLLCCSTAAGPCFEGAEISCGMGALSGAINRIRAAENGSAIETEHVFRFGPLLFTTISNAPPRGICGAALIDALAVMKKLSALDETGALTDEYVEDGFPIAEGITISQKDVRQFQLAKSAIRSGIDILCKKAGLKSQTDLSSVYVAGGLGFYIDPRSAVEVGLFPPDFGDSGKLMEENRQRIIACGNTSLKGAVKSLLDPSFITRCRNIVACSETAELSSDIDFSTAFAENMYF